MGKYLALAIECAKHNEIKKLPRIASVLVTKDKQVFIGLNRLKTHPLQKKFGKNQACIYLHAEIDAIVQASRNRAELTGAELYVARVGKDTFPRLAKPCPGCERAIIHFDISHVEWTV